MNAPAPNVAPLRRTEPTLSELHNRLLAKLTNLAVPPSCQVFDAHGERAWWLEANAQYLRAIIDAIEPVFSKAADDARGYSCSGASFEDFAIVEGGALDFISPFHVAADEELEASRGIERPADPDREARKHVEGDKHENV